MTTKLKVMIFTLHNTDAWWRYIASRLDFASKTVIVSDVGDADIDINRLFHQYVNMPGIEREAFEELGEQNLNDVILRCRLLRVLDHRVALKMIGAMWRTIQELLDREKPDLFLSFVIDRYILDLFERALARRGVRYVGMTIGVLPDTLMFMARGEYVPVREPSESEVSEAVEMLAEPDFVPSYVARMRFDLPRFLSMYVRFTARWLAFEALRLLRGRPYDFRYLIARITAAGVRVRLRDWGVMRYFRSDWRRLFDATSFERRVFVALPVDPEAAIDYWVRDLVMIDYRAVLERAAGLLGAAGFRLFVKDHPSQFSFRQVELFSALAKNSAVAFVPYDVPGRWLIDRSKVTLTWTGTVGLQAALAGRCAVVDVSAYYIVKGLFVALQDVSDLDGLAQRIESFEPSLPLGEARRALALHLLRASVPGAYLSWRRFDPYDPGCVRRADSVVASLNHYLPGLA